MTTAFWCKDEFVDLVEANLDRFIRQMNDEETRVTVLRDDSRTPATEEHAPAAIMRAFLGGGRRGASQGGGAGAVDVTAFEAGSKPLYIFDRKGIIHFANAALEALLGYPQGGLQRKHLAILNFHSIEENARIVAGIIVDAQLHGDWKGTLSYRRKDDAQLIIPTHIQPYEAFGYRYWIAVTDKSCSGPLYSWRCSGGMTDSDSSSVYSSRA